MRHWIATPQDCMLYGILFQYDFGEGGTTGGAGLGLYNVDSCDFFVDSVFDLYPCSMAWYHK